MPFVAAFRNVGRGVAPALSARGPARVKPLRAVRVEAWPLAPGLGAGFLMETAFYVYIIIRLLNNECCFLVIFFSFDLFDR